MPAGGITKFKETGAPGQGSQKKAQGQLAGNMSGVSLQVDAAPSAKVSMTHEFPGAQRPVNRFALMPEEARRIVLGIVNFGQGDK